MNHPGSPVGPNFDGRTYDPLIDYLRLSAELQDLWDTLTADPEAWWSLSGLQGAIASRTGRRWSEAGLSARLRDLRKPKFGRYAVETRRVRQGLFAYRLNPGHYQRRAEATRRGGHS